MSQVWIEAQSSLAWTALCFSRPADPLRDVELLDLQPPAACLAAERLLGAALD